MAFFSLRNLLGGAVLTASTAGPALAQAIEPRNLATDTLQPANARYHYPVSRLGTAKGQQLYVFITNVSERGNGVEFTWRNPLAVPRPRPVFITSEQLHWVRQNGGYFEPMRVVGKEATGLAQRVMEGPRLELFDVATPKKGVPIPLPGAIIPILWTGMFSDKYNHAYYLRRPGEATMTPVPDGKKFGPFMADYLADVPALADSIRLGTKGYRYDDTPALLARHKARLPAGGGR